MTPTDRLEGFVRAGLAAGRAPGELGRDLARAGWSDREIAAALGAWTPAAPGLPPVPRPRPYVSAGEAVIYGLMFLLLATICWHVTTLGFDVLDRLLPDHGDVYDPPRSGLRWSVAVLVISVPLFFWLNARVARTTRGDPGRRRSLVRKWLAAVTMLLAAVALLSDAVAVIYAFLNGDLTARFLGKAALVALIGGLALAYYKEEIDAA